MDGKTESEEDEDEPEDDDEEATNGKTDVPAAKKTDAAKKKDSGDAVAATPAAKKDDSASKSTKSSAAGLNSDKKKDDVSGDKDDDDVDDAAAAAAAAEPNDKNKEEEHNITLGEIYKINSYITNTKVDGLQVLHQICFDTIGKPMVVKKNLRKFEGFEFESDSEEFKKRLDATKKVDINKLKALCDGLDIEKKGIKENNNKKKI